MPFMPFIQSLEQLIEAIAAAGITIPPGTAISRHISHPFLLKGLANGWWAATDICSNPNLQWSWIEEHLDDLDIEAVLMDNRTISWPQLEELMSLTEEPGYASGNPIMPFSYILEHPEIEWNVDEIIERDDYDVENEVLYAVANHCSPIIAPRRITYDMVVDGEPHTDTDYDQFSSSPNIPVKRIMYDLVHHHNEDIWDIGQLCRHPHLTQEIIEDELRINWEWYPLRCKDMTKEALISLYEQYKDEFLAGVVFWSHPEITLDMIGTIEPLSTRGLVKNPNLTWDFIIGHLDLLSNTTGGDFRAMLARDDWSQSEMIARRHKWTAIRIQRWYRRVTVFDLTFPRAEKRFRLAMEEMYS